MPGKDLEEWSVTLSDAFTKAAAIATNEMELREHVHQVISDAILDLYGLSSDSTSSGRQIATGGKRRYYDRLYGGVVVEWEFSMNASRREHGAEQALEYLQLIREKTSAGDAFSAVVSDGQQWGFLIVDPAGAEEDLFTVAPTSSSDHFVWRENSSGACRQFLELIGSHNKTPVSPATLTGAFGPTSATARRTVAVLAEALASRSAGDRADTLYKEWRRALDVVYGDLGSADGELVRHIEEAYDVPSDRTLGELLYTLHTYFALVARLIAVELLATSANDVDARPTTWRSFNRAELVSRLRRLEAGESPGGLEVANLFEADVFSWWGTQAESNYDLVSAISDVLASIDNLAFPRVVFGPAPAGDVLRDLYQSLIPRQLRKALGEFLTPTWLAQACLERLESIGAPLKTGRILDPTCGTGTFLLPILTPRLRALQSTAATVDDVQNTLNQVCGVDINPVAVIAARVNYVIALGSLASVGALTIPIWHADSLIVPDAPPAQGTFGDLDGLIYRHVITSLDEPFPIPLSMTRSSHLGRLRHLLEEPLKDVESAGTSTSARRTRARSAADDFMHAFEGEFQDVANEMEGTSPRFDWNNEKEVARVLFSQLASLAVEGRNGVWARIIENAFAPLFAGHFDVVVGNPPWLTWTRLPNTWRRASERVWRRYGLWAVPKEPGAPFSLASTDLATLVFAVALDRYVRDDGYVGLLTPDSLLTADPGGRAYRQFRLRPAVADRGGDSIDIPFAIRHVDDWATIQPFAPAAANRPVFIAAQRGNVQGATTPGTRWARAGGRLGTGTWAEVRRGLEEKSGTYRPVTPSVSTSAWLFQEAGAPELIEGGSNSWEFGKGLDTRGANGIYFVRLAQVDRQRKQSSIVNIPSAGRDKDVEGKRGRVELELLYPLLRGRDVQAWRAQPSTYFILPHNPDDLSRVLTAEDFRDKYPLARNWLRRHKDSLARRRTPPTRSWKMDGDDWCRVDGPLAYMHGEHLVVVREQQQRPAAALVESRYDFELGRKTAPLIDHKLLFCSVPSKAEALYLCAMINSTPLQDLLESYGNSIAISPTTLRRLPIPAFDEQSDVQQAVIKIAEEIDGSESPLEEAKARADSLDQAALRALSVDTASFEPQRRRIGRSVRRSRHTEVSEDDVLF